jgi:hypothetical protein
MGADFLFLLQVVLVKVVGSLLKIKLVVVGKEKFGEKMLKVGMRFLSRFTSQIELILFYM